MWRSAKGDASPWVEFDLGEVQSLGAICLWNFNDAWYTDRGVRKADISVWTQEAGWKKIHDDLAIEQAQGSEDYDEPMFVRLDGVKAQKVRLDDLASFGDADFVGLSKVQFFASLGPQAVRPSPSDGDIGVGASGLKLAWIAGEGAKTHKVYFGVSPDDLKPLGGSLKSAARISQLSNHTKYYWRVDEVRADGSTAEGAVWSFATGGFAGWWRLDEKEGRKVADSSGNGHEAVAYGDPKWQPLAGRVGGALEFDGVDDYVDTGWTPHLPTWTVAAWVKSPAAPTAPVSSGPVHCEENFQFSWNHGNQNCQGAVLVRVAGAWHSAGFGELKPNTWYHLAGTYDGENLKAYKDGVLITDKADPSGDADSGIAKLTFGRHATSPDAFFTGAVDDVCVYAYALSAGNIQALHAGAEPSAVAARPVTEALHLLDATPAQAAGPYPADGAIGVAVSDLELTWVAGDQAKTHRVYLGGSPDDLKLLGRIEQVGAKMSQLDSNTKFYWRIDEVQADGSITSGKVWNFTTGAFAAWWKLDETEGSAVADSSGSGHHGQIHGNPVWQPQGGYVGGALEFDGVDDYVDTGWADLLPTWTVAAWVKSPAAPANAAPSGPVHRQDNLQINWNHHTDVSRGAAGARVGDSWHRASFGELKGGTWYHLAATYDGENLKAYKDGLLITDNADPSGPPSRNPTTLKLGRHAVDQAYFAGAVDDVCVFAYALSPKNVKALHSGTQPVAIASPKAASAPHLLQATLAEPAEPAVASTPASVVHAQPPVAEATPRGGRHGVAVIAIIGIIGLIAGISLFMRQRSQ
jgi:hypothetical protein